MSEQIAFSREEAARRVGLSLDSVRRAINRGALKAKRTGRDDAGNPTGKYVITERALMDWIESLPDA